MSPGRFRRPRRGGRLLPRAGGDPPRRVGSGTRTVRIRAVAGSPIRAKHSLDSCRTDRREATAKETLGPVEITADTGKAGARTRASREANREGRAESSAQAGRRRAQDRATTTRRPRRSRPGAPRRSGGVTRADEKPLPRRRRADGRVGTSWSRGDRVRRTSRPSSTRYTRAPGTWKAAVRTAAADRPATRLAPSHLPRVTTVIMGDIRRSRNDGCPRRHDPALSTVTTPRRLA